MKLGCLMVLEYGKARHRRRQHVVQQVYLHVNGDSKENTLRVDNSVTLGRTVCSSRACACEKRRRLGHRRVVCLSVRARALRPSRPSSIEDQYTSTTARANPITHATSLSRLSFAVQHPRSRLRCIRRASSSTAASFAGAAT
jgi:hypothetical protein